MFAKRLFNTKHNEQHGFGPPAEFNPNIFIHYGIPSTASILAFDPIQRLLAIGTLDGRIKVIGGGNIEGLFISSKQLPFKSLEFLDNQGYILSVSNENEIQLWDLEQRCQACCLQWESNITSFSVIQGTHFMYVGDENGTMSVLKYDYVERKLLKLPYHIPASLVADYAQIVLPNYLSVVGILPQPFTLGNRVVIAYENGLIILWDMSEARAVLVRGYAGLQTTDDVAMSDTSGDLRSERSHYEQEEKEICSLSWASTSGSILAVGYIDGDILLWNMTNASTKSSPLLEGSSDKVVKLQLSSGERRLPIITLNWFTHVSYNDCGGHLFVYGGEEVGSEEIITVLTIKWASSIETLKCVSRVDLSLNGSFADMILIPDMGPSGKNSLAALFVLTNPGQIHAYDGSTFSNLTNIEQGGKSSAFAEQFPEVIPTLDPHMTLSKLHLLEPDNNFSKLLLEIANASRASPTRTLFGGTKWPLTGGVPGKTLFPGDEEAQKLYVAGYEDGSVRIWDASLPVLSLVLVLKGEVSPIKVAGLSAPVSALDICHFTKSLAVGNEFGQVRIYKLCRSSGASHFHFVCDNQHEVHPFHQQKGWSCVSVVCVQNSPVRALKFTHSGAKLAVGFESGQVAIVDTDSFLVLSCKHYISGSTSPVTSIVSISTNIGGCFDHAKLQENRADSIDGSFFVLTKDAHAVIIDGANGHVLSSRPLHPKKVSTAISLHVIASDRINEAYKHVISQDNSDPSRSFQKTEDEQKSQDLDVQSASDVLLDSVLILCCIDAIRLYSIRTIIEGGNKAARKIKLEKPCCWSATFKIKSLQTCGLILLYQTGHIEIRSLPTLEVIGESSLLSILRWNFKPNMEKTITSTDDALIVLVSGCELAFISLLEAESNFGIPETLPCLHDKELAAAADAAINFSLTRKKKQSGGLGILGGIMMGFKGGKVIPNSNSLEVHGKYELTQQLESTFSNVPLSEPSAATESDEILDIDDIDIDETPMASTSSNSHEHRRGEEAERHELFKGATKDVKPRLRTPQEIRAQYRKSGDVSSMAADTRDKLVQRQEKLERIGRRTAELQSGAENFSSMANELVKTLESRKWWQI